MKTILILAFMTAISPFCVFSAGQQPAHGGHGPRVQANPGPSHAARHDRHDRHGDRRDKHDGFWPGFFGGLIAGAIIEPIVKPVPVAATPAVIVQPAAVQPVVTVQTVWVDGRYVDTVTPSGTVIRTWQPGHYEQRTVVVK